ncbi:MAG: T9SS type A sorting domain-containing protein [Bacteroidia bacterium]
MWTLYPDGAGGWDTTDQGSKTTNSFTTFGEGVDGELYIAERGGDIFKITTEEGTGITKNLTDGGVRVWSGPNPFSDQLDIRYQLKKPMHVKIEVLDMTGRTVRTLADNHFTNGEHNITWKAKSDDGSDLEQGVYLLVFRTEGNITTHKLSLIK